jgi:hypothetical protein
VPIETAKKTRKGITDLLARNAKTGPDQSRMNIKDTVVQGLHPARVVLRSEELRHDDAGHHRAEPDLYYRVLPAAER